MTDQPGGRRAALVTGASRGIGKVVALRLASLGYDVGVNYNSAQSEADRVVQEAKSFGVRAEALRADLSDHDQARKLVRQAYEAFHKLTVVINNAGITRDKLVLQMSSADWDATWTTDLAGPRAVCRTAMQLWANGQPGRIVNVGSVVGSTGNPGQANYAAAKSALLGLTREMSLAGATRGITVNCVVPGYIITDATSHLTEGQQQSWIDRIPMRRSATADDVADAVIFFAAGPTSYVTGQCLAVDGGLLAAAGQGLAS